MAVTKLGVAFKSAISKWCRVKIKKIKMPGKDKKVKDHLFASDKCQFTFHKFADKIDEIIDELNQFMLESEIESLVDDTIATHAQNQFAHHGTVGHENATSAGAGGTTPSDRRLKTDINFVGKSPSGINIYTFRFIDSRMYGKGLYQGVMSDEVPESVVVEDTNGYDMVNYDQIDVDFVQINKV